MLVLVHLKQAPIQLTHICAHANTYAHTYAHTYTHAHTHTHTRDSNPQLGVQEITGAKVVHDGGIVEVGFAGCLVASRGVVIKRHAHFDLYVRACVYVCVHVCVCTCVVKQNAHFDLCVHVCVYVLSNGMNGMQTLICVSSNSMHTLIYVCVFVCMSCQTVCKL
jgi:hypothetical protein